MKKIIITIAAILLPLSAHAGFTLNQTGVNSDGVANSSSISCTFASNPAQGALLMSWPPIWLMDARGRWRLQQPNRGGASARSRIS